TTPKLMQGTGHSITAVTTSDANTLSELITVTNTGGTSWQVTGSSSGALGAPLTCAASSSCAFSNAKVNFTLNTGGTINAGDKLDFATLAASNDATAQKKLLFANTGTALNNGRSKITIAAGAGFHAVGVSTAPTLIDMMASGGTYYTFVDSGAFTISFATIADADENGVWLAGSGGVSMSNSVFNYAGNGASSTST